MHSPALCSMHQYLTTQQARRRSPWTFAWILRTQQELAGSRCEGNTRSTGSPAIFIESAVRRSSAISEYKQYVQSFLFESCESIGGFIAVDELKRFIESAGRISSTMSENRQCVQSFLFESGKSIGGFIAVDELKRFIESAGRISSAMSENKQYVQSFLFESGKSIGGFIAVDELKKVLRQLEDRTDEELGLIHDQSREICGEAEHIGEQTTIEDFEGIPNPGVAWLPEDDRHTTRAGRCRVLAPSWWLSPGNTEAGEFYSAGMKGSVRKSYQGPQRTKRRRT